MKARKFIVRTPEAVREAAAKLCERLGRDSMGHEQHLKDAAMRIRRLPLAGLFGQSK